MTYRALSLRLSLVAAVCAVVGMAHPAAAEIEKFMNPCDGGVCAFVRASTTVPEGWAEHAEATRELRVQMLLPKGQDFDEAPAKIYTLVRYNAGRKLQVADIVKDTYADWRSRAKAAKLAATPEKLADIARADGKPAFVSHRFEAPRLKEQGFERTSITTDTDKDGNSFFVIVVLSANSRDAFVKAEGAYNSILKSY
jgi:hypothetical protein